MGRVRFYLALETAMRKGEILSLRWSDIDFDARHAHLDITKNGDERDVPLSKAARIGSAGNSGSLH